MFVGRVDPIAGVDKLSVDMNEFDELRTCAGLDVIMKVK